MRNERDINERIITRRLGGAVIGQELFKVLRKLAVDEGERKRG